VQAAPGIEYDQVEPLFAPTLDPASTNAYDIFRRSPMPIEAVDVKVQIASEAG
jgi:hypothetical protein